MKRAFAVLLLCIVFSQAADLPIVTADEADICDGKTKYYRMYIIDAFVKPGYSNCTYLFAAASGKCGTFTRTRSPVNETYLCYNTDQSLCWEPNNILNGTVTRFCPGKTETFNAKDVIDYKYKNEILMVTEISVVNVYVDISCDGLPYTPPRVCSFAYSLPITFMLLALLAILLF